MTLHKQNPFPDQKRSHLGPDQVQGVFFVLTGSYTLVIIDLNLCAFKEVNNVSKCISNYVANLQL